MANYRCFNSSNNTIQTASDYSLALKQKTIYSNVAQNMSLVGNANPQKKNGFLYNNNFGVVPLTTHTSAGCLINSQSYDLLLNVTKWQSLYDAQNNIINGFSSIGEPINSDINDSWAGNLFSINYSNKDINVVVDTSYNAGNSNEIIYPQPITSHDADVSFNNSYPGVIVDPSYLIFYNPCLSSFNSRKNPWLHLVNVTFNDTNYYQTAVKNNPFANFSYPKKVIFACSPIDEFKLDCSVFTVNTSSASVTTPFLSSAPSYPLSISFIQPSGNSGFLNKIEIYIRVFGSRNTLNLSIDDQNNNQIYNENFFLATSSSAQIYTLVLSTPLQLNPGDTYTIHYYNGSTSSTFNYTTDAGNNNAIFHGQPAYFYLNTYVCGKGD